MHSAGPNPAESRISVVHPVNGVSGAKPLTSTMLAKWLVGPSGRRSIFVLFSGRPMEECGI